MARERAELLDALDNVRAATLAQLLRRRGIHSVCPVCDGFGVRNYPGGSTWGRSAAAPCQATRDVCDSCWGSGDNKRPWYDLRRKETQRLMGELATEELERACRLAVELFEAWEGTHGGKPAPDKNNWRRRVRRCRIHLGDHGHTDG